MLKIKILQQTINISSTFSEYCTGGYEFGFNGQEKDQEIFNNQSTTTAMFWEYDGRIGRRWNIDPVVKSWQSTYVCFSDNPIIRIDPNGDDDFFDIYGNFKGHTETKFNYIRIINSNQTYESAKENVTSNTKLLSEYNYLPNEFANRTMLKRIVNTYSYRSIKNTIGFIDISKEDASFGTDPKTCEISLVINSKTGLINESNNISDQLISSLEHEKVHEVQGQELENYTGMMEIPAIMAQVNSLTFNKVTDNFKHALMSYATLSINAALSKNKVSIDDAKKAVDVIMNSKLGDYGLIQYDEKTNQVNYSLTLPMFETKDSKINK